MEQRLELRGGTLGSGAFAAVYRGSYDGIPVAVKVLLPQHANAAASAPERPDCPARLLRGEGELLLRAPHACQVRCHAVLTLPPDFPGLGRGYAAPAPALVLELMEGGSLTSLLHKQLIAPWKPVYDVATAAEWAAQLAEALAHLHTCEPPILHRDIKVENVMLQRGIAQQQQQQQQQQQLAAAAEGDGVAAADSPREPSAHGGVRTVAKLVDLGLHTTPALLDRCTGQPLFRVPAPPPPPAATSPSQAPARAGTTSLGGSRRSLLRSGSQDLATTTTAGMNAAASLAAATAAPGSLSTGGPLKPRHRLSSPAASPSAVVDAAAAALMKNRGAKGRVTISGAMPCKSADASAHIADSDNTTPRHPLFFTPAAPGCADLVPVDVRAACARQLTAPLPLLPVAVTRAAVEQRGEDGVGVGGGGAVEDGGLFDIQEEVQVAQPPRSMANAPLLSPEDVAALFGGIAGGVSAVAAATPAQDAALAEAEAATLTGCDFAFPHGNLQAPSSATPTAAAAGIPSGVPAVAAAVRCEALSLRALHMQQRSQPASPVPPSATAIAAATAAVISGPLSCSSPCGGGCNSTSYQPWWQEGSALTLLAAGTAAGGDGGAAAASALQAPHACSVQISGASNTSSMCITGAAITIATATTTHTGMREFSELNLMMSLQGQSAAAYNASVLCNGSSIGCSPDDAANGRVSGSSSNCSLARVAVGSSAKQQLLPRRSSSRRQQQASPVGVILEAALEPCSSAATTTTTAQQQPAEPQQDEQQEPTATLPPTALQRMMPAALTSPFAQAAATAVPAADDAEGEEAVGVKRGGGGEQQPLTRRQQMPRHSCPAGSQQCPTASRSLSMHVAKAEGRAPRASEGSPCGGVLPQRPYCLSEHCPPRGDAAAAAAAACSDGLGSMASAAGASEAAGSRRSPMGISAADRSISCPAPPVASAAAAHEALQQQQQQQQQQHWCDEPSFRPRDGAPAHFAEAAASRRRSSDEARQQQQKQQLSARLAVASTATANAAAAALVMCDDDCSSVQAAGRHLPEVSTLVDDSPRAAEANGSSRHVGSMAGYAPLVPYVPPYERVWRLTGETGSCMTMSPEVYLGLPYNEKADVFSFGVLLYELFTRTLLAATHIGTKRPDLPRILHRCEDYALAVARGYRPARTPGVPDPVWALITQCWQQDPLRRPAMPAVAARLKALARELTAAAAAEAAEVASRPGASSRRALSTSLSGLGFGGGSGRRSGFGGCVGGGGGDGGDGGQPAAPTCTGCVIC